MQDRGWEETHTSANVVAHWDQIVGPEISSHCRPASLIDGKLRLVAESTAWATQLRLMNADLLQVLADRAGPGVVKVIEVHAPMQPDWQRGPRRVRGRGPRDTYG